MCAERNGLEEQVARTIDAMISRESEETNAERSTLRTSVGVVEESPVGTLRFPSPTQPRLAA